MKPRVSINVIKLLNLLRPAAPVPILDVESWRWLMIEIWHHSSGKYSKTIGSTVRLCGFVALVAVLPYNFWESLLANIINECTNAHIERVNKIDFQPLKDIAFINAWHAEVYLMNEFWRDCNYLHEL